MSLCACDDDPAAPVGVVDPVLELERRDRNGANRAVALTFRNVSPKVRLVAGLGATEGGADADVRYVRAVSVG